MNKKKVVRHLKGDIKTFKKEAQEDRELIKSLKSAKSKSPTKKKKEEKIERVMHEYKEGELHSGSKKGPIVKNRRQALAIAISESKKKKKNRR